MRASGPIEWPDRCPADELDGSRAESKGWLKLPTFFPELARLAEGVADSTPSGSGDKRYMQDGSHRHKV